MPKYKITFMNRGTEDIEAERYADIDKTWIDFYAGDVLKPQTVLRVRADQVRRIDVVTE